jgi:lipoate-protein ligase B
MQNSEEDQMEKSADMRKTQMTEEWNEKLECPKCHKAGMASLSQAEEDKTPTVLIVPDGFKVVTTQRGGIDFHCVSCDVAVRP